MSGLISVEVSASLRAQVVAQMRVVASLAQSLSEVHEQLATAYAESGPADELLEMKGAETAALMETLGNILNEMDATSEDDKWMAPIFAEAQRRWPQP